MSFRDREDAAHRRAGPRELIAAVAVAPTAIERLHDDGPIVELVEG